MKAAHLQLTGAGLLAFAMWSVLEKGKPGSGPFLLHHPLSNREPLAFSYDSTAVLAGSGDIVSAPRIAENFSGSQQTRVFLPPASALVDARHEPAPIGSHRSAPSAPIPSSSGAEHYPLFEKSALGNPKAAPRKPPGPGADISAVQTPVVLLEIEDPAVSNPEAKERLAAVAADFAAELTGSGLDPAGLAYRQLWDRERIAADTLFRSMYGGQAWVRHHIQLHHARAQGGDQ